MSDQLHPSLADTVGFNLLDPALAADIKSVLQTALNAGVVFPAGKTALAIFRDAVRMAIGRIHENGRAPLLLRFLTDGPYEDGGTIPPKLRDKRLSDDETAAVTGFIHSHMVNCFKGAITELLAVGPCVRLLNELREKKGLPRGTQLFLGDTVWSRRRRRNVFAKGADMHLLVIPRVKKAAASVCLAGVVEVKSYFPTEEALRRQLKEHISRARRGLRVCGKTYPTDQANLVGEGATPARVYVVPDIWPLPRRFRFETKRGQRFLHVDPPQPPIKGDLIEPRGDMTWRVTLRWSKESLDAAGYGMTFWLMEKVGEALYAHGVPKEWSEMTPAEAGQNAAKQSLYYAILRARKLRDEQRAIAIYNSYGFGCALGMNFRNNDGRREMLWPQDLDEICARSVTKSGCRIK